MKNKLGLGMSDVRYVVVNDNEDGQRLDNYLIRVLKGVPKSHIYRIIRHGEVRVNKKRAQVSQRLACGDRIRIPPIRTTALKEVRVSEPLSERLQAGIIYEDHELLVMNKPAGIAVHGGSGLSLGLIEALRQMRSDLPYLELVHRLDKDTSGCIVLAKKRSVLRAIQALLEAREIKKTYWAILVRSWQEKPSVTVNVALEKNTLQSGERLVIASEAGKASSTRFQLLENYADACWVEASPKTGRTHQIRVHSAHLDHPILGDEKYGGDCVILEGSSKKQRLYLHARAIQFTLNGKVHCYQAELDCKFQAAIDQLRLRRP